MVKVYGVAKVQGFCVGDNEKKILIGTYTKTNACKFLMDDSFIQSWNDNNIAKIYKLVFEVEE